MERRTMVIVIGVLAAALATGVLVAYSTGSGGANGATLASVGIWMAVVITIAVFMIAVLPFVAVARRRIKQGPRSLVETARRLNLTYQRQAHTEFLNPYHGLPGVPASATGSNVMVGTLDVADRPPLSVTAFNSTFMLNAGQVVVPVVSTVFVTEAPDWPTVELSPRSFFGRLMHRMGLARGLELENEAFCRQFRVFAADQDFGLLLLSPEMQAFMLSKPNVRWRVGGGRVCLVYRGSMKADRIEGSLHRLCEFWSHVPPELDDWQPSERLHEFTA